MCDVAHEEYEGRGVVFDQEVRFAIVKYLDASGNLENLEEAGTRYKGNLLGRADDKRLDNLPSFTYTLQLDLSQVAEICVSACSLILEEPLTALQLFREVVHCSLVTLCLMPTLTIDQVQVVLRVSSLPAEDGLKTVGAKRPDPTTRRLLLLQGVAAAVTNPIKYTRSGVFRCQSLSCPGAAGLRVWGPSASQRRCRYCGRVADETPRGRDVGDHLLALLVDPAALNGHRGDRVAFITHPVLVRFSDDLANPSLLQLGCRYDVVVLFGPLAEAWGVRPWQDGALCRVARGLRSDPLPDSVQSIWVQTSANTGSAWAFAVCLASQVDTGRYPAHAFLHLKLGILLSLASQGLDHPPVPLLAVGWDPAGQSLLSRCARLADRSVSVNSVSAFSKLPAMPLSMPSGSGRRTAETAGAWLSAGPLILAQGGVCLLGCWDKWNRTSAAVSVTAALESGKAAVERRDLAGVQLPGAGPSVPLQCAVWTYWSPRSSGKVADFLTLRTLLNTLGAPVLAESSCHEETEALCDHLLKKAQGEHKQCPVVLEKEIREFLALVNAQPVSLTDEATRLIQDYFVASRRVRPNCLPVTAVGTIAAMAEALARISLRMEATWADVVLVVWMYEVAFTALFGPCLISPLPDVCNLPLQAEHFSEQMDCRLNNMKVWLENFTRSVLLSSLRVERDDGWV